MTLPKRIINMKFALGTGDFGEAGQNTVELTGLRTHALIVRAAGPSVSELTLTVKGVPLKIMNKLTVLYSQRDQFRYNTVEVSAGDTINGVSVCFVGGIQEAWADISGEPEGQFRVTALSSMQAMFKPVQPVSYNGVVDVALAASGIAAQMQLGFTNYGVTSKMHNLYLHGTAMDQLRALKRASGFEYSLDDANLIIWPRGSARQGLVVDVNSQTGLIGYPSFTQTGITFSTLYNPSINVGTQVKVSSTLTTANGLWSVSTVGHDLEAETPNGKWFTHVETQTFGSDIAQGLL